MNPRGKSLTPKAKLGGRYWARTSDLLLVRQVLYQPALPGSGKNPSGTLASRAGWHRVVLRIPTRQPLTFVSRLLSRMYSPSPL